LPEPLAGGPVGKVHILRSDLLPDAKDMLQAMASVVLIAARGSMGQQIDALSQPSVPRASDRIAREPQPMSETPPQTFDTSALEYFNGTGGFSRDGREYVIVLQDGQTTPAPWINVIANPGFGFQVSALGSGHVWSENSRENQLTPWSNDPVTDPEARRSGCMISTPVRPGYRPPCRSAMAGSMSRATALATAGSSTLPTASTPRWCSSCQRTIPFASPA